MYRSAAASARSALRASSQSSLAPARTAAGRRFITTEPPHAKSRTWKNSALRWGLAAAGIYYYNTSPVFAEQPQHNLLNPNVDALADDRETSTLDQLTASSRARAQKDASVLQSAIETTSAIDASPDTAHLEHSALAPAPAEIPAPETAGAAALEEEAEGEGAFNPITGEINWDCPCLGGMAYGPCGEEFRAAFSCFVYSQEEPKGMECIDKFQGMQDCFRAHPEHYKAELEDDLEAEASGELQKEREELEKEVQERRAQVQAQQEALQKKEDGEKPAPKKKSKAKQPKEPKSSETPQSEPKQQKGSESPATPEVEATQKESASPTTPSPQVQSESEGLVPKAAHDARS